MNNRYLLEKQTGHPEDPGDVKWFRVHAFFDIDCAKIAAQSLSYQEGYAETGLRIYDKETEEVIWSNF